jgi:Raf kinase inhibitor-like YbhB/YbcL family protein
MMLKTASAIVVMFAILNTAAGAEEAFVVTSPDVASGQFSDEQFANVFGCSGGNISPALAWSGAPAGTRSFSVTVYDPDAPTGSGFWHWIVADIPPTAQGLPAGSGTNPDLLPPGSLQMINDAGVGGYVGACPPAGETHNYVITVKALGVDTLPLPPTASGAMVGFVTNANLLASATLVVAGEN